jgi:hypothetical protein
MLIEPVTIEKLPRASLLFNAALITIVVNEISFEDEISFDAHIRQGAALPCLRL